MRWSVCFGYRRGSCYSQAGDNGIDEQAGIGGVGLTGALLIEDEIVAHHKPRTPSHKPIVLLMPRTPSLPSRNAFTPSPTACLGDTLQLLALHRPAALRLLESWANKLADPVRKKLADEQAS